MTFIQAYALTRTCKQLTKMPLPVPKELKPKLETKAGSLSLTILFLFFFGPYIIMYDC